MRDSNPTDMLVKLILMAGVIGLMVPVGIAVVAAMGLGVIARVGGA